MYIDESIHLREDLPKALLQDFIELKKFYDQGDWFQFDNLFECVEGSVKAYYHNGKISKEDLELIFQKYGIA